MTRATRPVLDIRGLVVHRDGTLIRPGGTTEISRWSSDEGANTTGSHRKGERTPDGVPEAARELPAHPPGRMIFV